MSAPRGANSMLSTPVHLAVINLWGVHQPLCCIQSYIRTHMNILAIHTDISFYLWRPLLLSWTALAEQRQTTVMDFNNLLMNALLRTNKAVTLRYRVNATFIRMLQIPCLNGANWAGQSCTMCNETVTTGGIITIMLLPNSTSWEQHPRPIDCELSCLETYARQSDSARHLIASPPVRCSERILYSKDL